MHKWEDLFELFNSEDADGLRKFISSEILPVATEFSPSWHPLGFVHCKLYGDSQQTFRLHIWPTSRSAVNPQSHKVHDHLFDVHSIVLAGVVKAQEFAFHEDNCSPWRVVRVDYQTSPPILFETDVQGDLQLVSEMMVEAGRSYMVPKGILHATELYSTVDAVTIVRTSHPHEYKPRVMLPLGEPLPAPRTPVWLGARDWVEIINDALG